MRDGPRAHARRRDDELLRPAGRKVGEVAANVLSSPGREMREDIENFARKAERAEIEWSGPGARAR